MDYNFDNVIDNFLVKQNNSKKYKSNLNNYKDLGNIYDKNESLKENFELYIKNDKDLIYLKSDGDNVSVTKKDNYTYNRLIELENIIDSIEADVGFAEEAKHLIIGKHESEIFTSIFGKVPKEFYNLKVHVCNKESYVYVI